MGRVYILLFAKVLALDNVSASHLSDSLEESGSLSSSIILPPALTTSELFNELLERESNGYTIVESPDVKKLRNWLIGNEIMHKSSEANDSTRALASRLNTRAMQQEHPILSISTFPYLMNGMARYDYAFIPEDIGRVGPIIEFAIERPVKMGEKFRDRDCDEDRMYMLCGYLANRDFVPLTIGSSHELYDALEHYKEILSVKNPGVWNMSMANEYKQYLLKLIKQYKRSAVNSHIVTDNLKKIQKLVGKSNKSKEIMELFEDSEKFLKTAKVTWPLRNDAEICNIHALFAKIYLDHLNNPKYNYAKSHNVEKLLLGIECCKKVIWHLNEVEKLGAIDVQERLAVAYSNSSEYHLAYAIYSSSKHEFEQSDVHRGEAIKCLLAAENYGGAEARDSLAMLYHNSAEFHLSYAILLSQQKKYVEAISHTQKAIDYINEAIKYGHPSAKSDLSSAYHYHGFFSLKFSKQISNGEPLSPEELEKRRLVRSPVVSFWRA